MVFYGATMIITITSSTVIACLSSTVVPPLGITILRLAFRCFINEIQSEETEKPITRCDK